MPRRLSLCLAALGCIATLLAGPALAGVDQGYAKAEGRLSAGGIFSWAFGGEPLGKSYALVIGVSNYSGQGFEPLETTAGDPERMRRFLLDEAGFDYVHVLTDEKVTQSRLRTLLLDDFRGRVNPEDQFLLYWSGHGIPVTNFAEQELGYLPLATSTRTSLASMLGMSEILGWTDLIGAGQVLHVLDTCFSGLARLAQTKSGPRDRTVALLAKPARHLLTATTGGGATIAAREWNGSIFTDAFIEGAEGAADGSGDGVVDMLELEGFIRDKVNERRLRINWPSEIKPKSYDLQQNEGEFFFITDAKKREVAHVDDTVAIEAGMPVVLLGPGAGPPNNPACDADGDRLFWATVKDKTEAAYFEAYLDRVSSGELCGRFASLAEIELSRLRTAPPRAPPPEAPPTRERVIQIQEMLADLGFDSGRPDGDLGPRTRSAIIAFQRSIGAPATGRLTDDDEIALAKAYADRPAPPRAPEAGKTFRDCPDCPEMMVIPAGSFLMGSPEGEDGRDSDEGPQHRVTIGSRFALGKHEVTRGQFARFVAATGHEASDCRYWDGDSWEINPGKSWRDPGYAQTDEHPVVCVSYEDAQAYIEWLKTETNEPYRLPSEAEWEYAARAGTTSRFFWGDDADTGCSYANGADQTGQKEQPGWTIMDCDDGFYGTAPVGSYRANRFGLHDMTGNVWEWLEDRWHENYDGAPADGSPWIEGNNSARVLRGGSWGNGPGILRTAGRGWGEPGFRLSDVGFRVARTLTP